MFSFKYSPRPNTLASKRMPDDVPEEEKTRRIVALQALQRDDSGRAVYAARSAGRVAVLVDARSRRRDWELSGRTSGNTVVNFAGPAGLDRADRAGADHGGEPEQPAGRGGELDTVAIGGTLMTAALGCTIRQGCTL